MSENSESPNIESYIMEPKQQVLLSQLLVNILLTNDNVKELTDKLTIKLSDKVLTMLRLLLNKSPKSLDLIVENLTDILKDGTIDHKDIPKMIVLVSNLYMTDFKQVVSSQSLTTNDIVNYIIFLLKLVIDLDYIKVNNKMETFDIIDASAVLLELVIVPQKVSMNCFSCLFNKRN
jgi:hypothetical protein